MTDNDRIQLLQARLRELELRIPSERERSIVEVARAALEEELTSLGRKLLHREYWRSGEPRLRSAS